MSMDYIRRTYDVPARRGMRVAYAPSSDRAQPAYEGVIIGSRGAYLRVKLTWLPDGRNHSESWSYHVGCVLTLHPTWRVGYDVTGGVDAAERVTEGVAHE